jgi:hypothetical protein
MQTAADENGKRKSRCSYHNARALHKKIDEMPKGPEWLSEIITVTGDRRYPPGHAKAGLLMTEELELFWRDPVAVIKELIGNPAFKDVISYVPQRVYADKGKKERVYDECWTGDWWWETQVKSVHYSARAKL